MAFVDHRSLFRIGMGWGGTTSLVLALPGIERPGADYGERLVRLDIGLEEIDDLTADLAQALVAMTAP